MESEPAPTVPKAASRRVAVLDTTLRDGEQSPGISLDVGEKLSIATQLATLGVDVIEAGFPIASTGDHDAVRAVAQAAPGPAVAHARSLCEDVEFTTMDCTRADRLRPRQELAP